ncbi:hypothetical protein Q4555_15600 [Octadecabacter sp. 1_MG-2023]|uniref:spike base protein, RCAP_Rcc01079 family n=1 Tax=unclassified Octadecabacter TaxID=196158 RepID=UPI001C095848|nr:MULTISPECIES: hypothetical protein [unclassified Octadecabacter]MBU2994043.1 hypothetical protein [Octadecabacter sp. B2R22]MDO6736103.1 hypothetical protein [Octadecabacter sp. 1_MG-2023]
MSDLFSSQHERSKNDPAVRVFEVTPDDATDLPYTTLALNVRTPGIVRVTAADGSIGDVSIHPGQPFALRAKRVWQTGTTATGIRGMT